MLNVYFLESQYKYLGWVETFLQLAIHLKENNKANLIHQKGGWLYIEKYDYNLPDCEIIIEDTEKDVLKAISWSESRTPLLDIFIKRNNPNDILMQTQFHHWFPDRNFDRNQFTFQLKPTTFYTFDPELDYDYWYYQRRLNIHTKSYNSFKDEMFFLFSTHREFPTKLREMGLCSKSPGHGLPINGYLNLAIQYKMGISAASVAEIAYREIEYMAIGLPNIRMEYMTQLEPKLIPDYHYISIPREGFEWNHHADRDGGDKYVEAYAKRFNETKNDYDFLEFITKNARDYYVEYCHPINRIKHILNSLNLKNEL